MAVAVEKSAKDFYTTLSKRFPQDQVFFDSLADDEEDHARRYRELLAGDEVYSTEEERMLADDNIQVLEKTGIVGSLRSGGARAQQVPDLKSALKVAIQMEKDTLLLYHNMQMELASATAGEIQKIIKMEYAHLIKVSKREITT